LSWGLIGLRLGSGVGFFAGILVISNFNILISFALAVNLSIFVLPLVLLYKHRRVVHLEARNWFEMVIGLSAGAVLAFVAALYYFWLSFLAIIVLAVANTGYRLIETRSSWNQTNVETRQLLRNLTIMMAVMAPLIFFAVFVTKGVSSIIAWAIAYAAFSSVIIAKYIKDRRQSRASA
jgi:hypothetical protein